MSGTAAQLAPLSAPAETAARPKAYYRPELDALRLFAFLSVFVSHAPLYLWFPGMAHRYYALAKSYISVSRAGVYGLCEFFFLSAFLISELLLREKEKTGTVHLRAFYMRRILRIWPLYYFAILLGIAVGWLQPHVAMSRHDVLYLVLFIAWAGGNLHGNPIGPLWSISVEELFYLAWPRVVKPSGARSMAIVSAVLVPVALAGCAIYWRHWWFNPLTQSLFFASGTLLALVLHRRSWSVPLAGRIGLFLAGVGLWVYVPDNTLPLPEPLHRSVDFLLVDIGCTLIFLAFFNLKAALLPRFVLYLGRISYGLYVFHLLILESILQLLLRNHQNAQRWPMVLLIQVSGLLLTVAVASLSYRFLEQPFLRLKKRFTFVQSGAPASA